MTVDRISTPVTLASLTEDWLGRCADFRPSAFWFWNSDMDRERMREVVEEMAANGIREFLIHPVHGMEVEYLSEEFFDCYRYALGLASEHDLKVWVYDEYGWPSGNVGGLLLRDHPEHKGWYLHFDRDEEGNVTAEPRQSDRILDNTMGAPWTKNETGYLDTLSPEAVGCFIEMTYERIRQECGKLFEEVVVGFFTDEPVCMVDAFDGNPGGWATVGMPWTPRFPEEFKKRFGYEIEPRYAELAGDGPSPVKRDYWELVKEIYTDAYHGQIGRWCREHGLKYTGHVGEDFPLMQVRFSGSVYQCLEQMDEPGIDFLGWGAEPEHRFIDHVLVPSIARHVGKERVYCEAYGITPYDIRLGEMLRRAQMFGIYGINDIALMGFQQSLDGVRKRTYWPPIFMEAPWWPFYPEFRDAFARSVGLTSFGVRKSRYAVLYPQNQLEQTDLFNIEIGAGTDPGARMMQTLGLAVYDAGESFEFVFPEMLDQARVVDGKTVFPHAEYEAVLAPSDVAYFDESLKALDRIASAGGRVLRGSLAEVEKAVSNAKPSWANTLTISGEFDPGEIRAFRFDYPDGELFAIRNVTDAPRELKVSSKKTLSGWDPILGEIFNCKGSIKKCLAPHGTLYITVSEEGFGGIAVAENSSKLPVDAEWKVTLDRPNTARLTNVRFRAGESGWLDAEDTSLSCDAGGRSPVGIPRALRGATRIEMTGDFECSGIPEELGIIYENAHLESLNVNGEPVDLSCSDSVAAWDKSCRMVKIRAQEGMNTVSGVVSYQHFETTIDNDAFLCDWCMPTCDVYVGGSFRLADGVISAETGSSLSLPVDFSSQGWSEYAGILNLTCAVEVDESLAKRIIGLEVDLDAQDCVELMLDGNSIGKRIIGPYRSELDEVGSGCHVITCRISGTSANLLANPNGWGVKAVNWIVRGTR